MNGIGPITNKPKPPPTKGLKPYPFNFVSRKEWGALNATDKPILLYHPVEYYTYTFTSSEPCNTRESCMQRVKELQKYHMLVKDRSDIPYNFMIGGDMTVYEGRGWYHRAINVDGNYKAYEGKFYDIRYMGYPGGGIKNNFYCVEILELRDALVDWAAENGFMDECAQWDRLDVWAV